MARLGFFPIFAVMKHHLVIMICLCATLWTACGKPEQGMEPTTKPAPVTSLSDSLRLDSLYRLADSLHQKALHYQDIDSPVASCEAYYHALDILEKRFSIHHLPEIEQLIKPERQMINLLSTIYKGMGALYSVSNLPDPTSYFYHQDLAIRKKYSKSPTSFGATLFLIGYSFDISDCYDSACYYYDSAIVCLDNDTSDFIFRQSLSRQTLIDYKLHHDATTAIHNLKALLPHCDFDIHDLEVNLGYIYKKERQYDSALVYLNRTFEALEQSTTSNTAARSETLSYLYEIYEALGDTVKMNEYAHLLAQYPHTQEIYAPTVTALNNLFNNYIQNKQAADALLEQQQMRQRTLWIVAIVALALLAVVLLLITLQKRHKKAEANLLEKHQQEREAFSQQLNEAHVAMEKKKLEDLVMQVTYIYGKGEQPRKRIIEAFNKAYPEAYMKLKSTYPDLTEKECDLLVLNFFRFRIKEEAEILELSENTVEKYRSRLIKKVGKSPVSDLVG